MVENQNKDTSLITIIILEPKLAYMNNNLPQVCGENSITSNNLIDVINGDIAAIRIPGFCSKEIFCEISDRLLMHPKKGASIKLMKLRELEWIISKLIVLKQAREAYHRNAIL